MDLKLARHICNEQSDSIIDRTASYNPSRRFTTKSVFRKGVIYLSKRRPN